MKKQNPILNSPNVPSPSAPQKPGDLPLIIGGRLTNSDNGYPLMGLKATAYYLEPVPQPRAKRTKTRLGSGVSGPGGAYQIDWIDSPLVSQRVCLLESCDGSEIVITLSDRDGKELLSTIQTVAAVGRTITFDIAVRLPKIPVTSRAWTAVGERMTSAGLTMVCDLVDQLATAQQSVFGDWSVTRKQNALSQLEAAFLDPRGILGSISALPSWQQLNSPGGLDAYSKSLGRRRSTAAVQQAFAEMSAKVTQLGSLSSVNWTMDSTQLSKNVGSAVTANQAKYAVSYPVFGPVASLLNTEKGYRDYLRTQWTSMITLVVYVQGHQLTVQQAEDQLTNRFHQDFRTQDDSSRPANEILIPILIEILTAPTGGTFGFGLSSSAIPPRGGAAARQYLDTLVALIGLSAQELTLRYRTDFTRPDTSESSPVWENIHTLQAFFRDSFQSVADPADAVPDVFAEATQYGQPIVPDVMQGKAPFFLEYDEWLLLQQPIYFENYFQLRRVFNLEISDATRQVIQNWANTKGQYQRLFQLYQGALEVQDQLQKAYAFLDQNEYKAAFDIFEHLNVPFDSSVVSIGDVVQGFSARRNFKVKSMDDLNTLLATWNVPDLADGVYPNQWAQFYQTRLACSLIYLMYFALPVLIAQASLGLGDYSTAVLMLGRSAWFLVGKATMSTTTAYRDFYTFEWEGSWLNFALYHAGNLPYTVDTEHSMQHYPNFLDDDSKFWGSSAGLSLYDADAEQFIPGSLHRVEQLFFKLQMGGAVVDWADSLYKTDDDSSISRARELYKGVYFLHGAIPPINPNWGTKQIKYTFISGSVNPAQASQLARAQLGFTQIAAGLNFFGYSEEMIPMLRYSTLKSAADTFATEAKSAERDFINFMGQLENATIESMRNTAMLQKADLNSQIAKQQAGIAQDQVKQAQIVITQVNTQITSAQQEIANHDSFFGELGDYISGMVGIRKGLPDWFTKPVGEAIGSEAGLSSTDTAGLLGLGAGASVMAGFAAFGVASYMTMSSMADAESQRAKKLGALQNQTLPSAQAQLDIAQRSVSIAKLQQQIADADAQLANQLLVFANDRYLSAEFWSYMASLMKRVLHRFLDLATRMGWLSQRALSYEQNTDVNVIKMDYFPTQEQGAGGADSLILDLAELEAERLDGLKEMIPIKFSFSLARDFPLQFAQLVSNGRSSFLTLEQSVQLAYPGTYGLRIIAVTPTITLIAANAPLRGLLTNSGISQISAQDGTKNVSVRPMDALPISEFNLGTTDMQIYGLPGGTLMQFEGSGVETIWTLDFPAAANEAGLSNLADILVTMDLRAQFSPDLYQTQIQQMPKSVSKFVFVSAGKQGIPGLTDLQGNATLATVAFDMTTIGLPAVETNRTLNNIAFLLIGAKNAASISASVAATKPAQKIGVTLVNGAAFSNAPPITDAQSTSPLSPLNALAGDTVDQTFSLVIDKTANAGVDFSTVRDVLLGIDYTASL